MSEENPYPPPNEPADPAGSVPKRARSLNPGEHFLLWAGLLLPGIISPFALILWFGIGYGQPGMYEIWMVLIPVIWLALLLGSCFLCGWIHAIKRGPEDRKRRALKAGGLFLLGQLVITPTLGFGCCALLMTVGSL